MNEELKIIISAEIDKLETAVADAKKEVDDFKKKSEISFSDFNDGVQSAGNVGKQALGVVAASVAGAATALLALSASTAEYRANQAKLNTAFEAAGSSADTAKSTYNDLYRVLGDDGVAVEAAGHLAKLTTQQDALAEWTNICKGVYATFGDSIPIESLAEGAAEASRTGTITAGLTDALVWAGIAEDDFNAKLQACTSQQEREMLIRDTLNNLYLDAAGKYEENSAQILAQNEAQAKLNESMAILGEAVAPVNTALTELGAQVLAELAPYIEQFAAEHLPSITEALSGVGEKIGIVINWIADNWELISTLATIILGIATAVSVFSTAMGIVNAVMAASPVTWIVLGIVAALAALVAIIVLCVKYWDEIKAAASAAVEWIKAAWETVSAWFSEKVIAPVVAYFSDLWVKIKTTFTNVKTWFNEKFKAAYESIKNAFSNAGSYFTSIWTKIKNIFTNVKTWFTDKFKDAWAGIKNIFSLATISAFFTSVWTRIKSIFTSIGSTIGGAVSNAFSTAINWVLSKAIGIINGFIGAINTAIGVINAIPGVEISKLATLEVPQLARGGIVDSATLAVVGERGKEAVVPLENNLGWLDKLAAMLNARMGNSGSTAPIILQVDGKTFAQISVDSINQLTRQTGSLPLNLV